jgi:hypothetical protein
MEPTNQQSLTKILVSRTEVFLHPQTRQQVNRETGRIYDHFPVVHRVLRNTDPAQRGRHRSWPGTRLKSRVDLSRFHRVTSFFRRAPVAQPRLGTSVPIDRVHEPR